MEFSKSDKKIFDNITISFIQHSKELTKKRSDIIREIFIKNGGDVRDIKYSNIFFSNVFFSYS